jgi:hypothetical protein
LNFRDYTADAGEGVDKVLTNLQAKVQLVVLVMRHVQQYEKEHGKIASSLDYSRLDEVSTDLKKVDMLENLLVVEAIFKKMYIFCCTVERLGQ